MSYFSRRLICIFILCLPQSTVPTNQNQQTSDISFVADSISQIVNSSVQQIKTPGVPAVILGTIQLIKWLLEKRQIKINNLDFTKHVANVPYKKFLFNSQEEISHLIDQATQGNFEEQVAARILLFDIKVPQPYTQYFHEGLKRLYPHCFTKKGDFYFTKQLPNLQKVFKKWYKKAPQTWQKIASLPQRKYKKFLSNWFQEEESPFYRSQATYDTLKIIQYGRNLQFLDLHVLASQYPNNTVIQQLKEIFYQKFITNNYSEKYIFKQAKHDPLAHKITLQKESKANQAMLILRWCCYTFLHAQLCPDTNNNTTTYNEIYETLPAENIENIINKNYPITLINNFLTTHCIGVHTGNNKLFTTTGVLQKYINDPLIKAYKFNTTPIFNSDIQKFINSGLLLIDYYKHNPTIQSLCYSMIKSTYESFIGLQPISQEIHLHTAKKIFNHLALIDPTAAPKTRSKSQLHYQIDLLPEEYQEAATQDATNDYKQDIYTIVLSFELQNLLKEHCISVLNYQYFQATNLQKQLSHSISKLLQQAYILSCDQHLQKFHFSIDNLLHIIDTAQLCNQNQEITLAIKLIDYSKEIIQLMNSYVGHQAQHQSSSFQEFSKKYSCDSSLCSLYIFCDNAPLQTQSTTQLQNSILQKIPNIPVDNMIKHKLHLILYKTCQIAELQYQINLQTRSWYKKLPLMHKATIFETSFEGIFLAHLFQANSQQDSR